MLTVEPLRANIAAAVEGIDLRLIDIGVAAELKSHLHEHGVLVFHNQSLSRDEQVALAGKFGAVHGHPVAEFVAGRADPLAVVYNDADKPPQGDQHFHVDYSFNTAIPEMAILRAEAIPPAGGDTQWSNMGAAYDALSPWLRQALTGLVAEHDAGAQFWFEMQRTQGDEFVARARTQFCGNRHSVIGRHPHTGRPLLFVNAGYTRRIDGLTERESEGILNILFDLIEQPELHYRHRWAEGDVVMWDEHLTTHKGPNDFYPATRCLTRVTAGLCEPVAFD